MRFLSFALLVTLSAFSARAGEFIVSPDREDGVYRAGETVKWTVQWQDDEQAPAPVAHYVFKLGGLTESASGAVELVNGHAQLESKIEKPNAMLLEITWDADGKSHTASAGAVASPWDLKPTAPAPEDFDTFWAAKIAELAAVPMAPSLTRGETDTAGVDYWKISLSNIRGTVINGQLARPAGNDKRPALLIVQWAGVYGLDRAWVTDRAKDGWLALNILPHELPIDETPEFYAAQKDGPLKDYWEIGNDDRENSYFLRMYLSCYRAVEYLKSRDDWNGETLVVMGTSQGGQQTLVTAGLHPDITAALALVPSGADMLAPSAGRAPAFPQWYHKIAGRDAETVRETSRYFDAANFAARIKVPLLIGAGLRDTVCPPATVIAAANAVQGYKELILLPVSGHQNESGSQEPYNQRAYQGWLPALRDGLPPPQAISADGAVRNMMAQLGITSPLRPGANPNDPTAPNAVNYDEAKANPYPIWPDPLVADDGSAVTTAAAWQTKRRAEIAEHFEREIYGHIPANAPGVTWEVLATIEETRGDIPVLTKRLAGRVDNAAYPFLEVTIEATLSTPVAATGPVPVVLHFGWPPVFLAMFPRPPGPTWEEQVLARGWGVVTMVPTSFQADNGAGLTQGVIGLTTRGGPRQPHDWGALRAWGWGASRVLDYLETDASVDARRVTLEGLSRYGKAVLVAIAFDERFPIGFIGSSGKGGATPLRRNFGELVENLAGSYSGHWMAGNFVKYASTHTWDDLPVDAHQLIALCAPRPIFMSAGSGQVEGQWIDQRGMFMATAAASPVYELLGRKGFGLADFPPQETTVDSGELAWRQHEGGHTTLPNWPAFFAWVKRYVPIQELAAP